MCNSSQQLWIEYFKMEMKAMQKLKARRLLLGLGPEAGKVAGRKDTTSSPSASVPTPSDGDGEGGGEVLADSSEDKLSLLLARQILKNAVAAIPSHLQFRMQFVEVLRGLDFKWRGMVEDEVYEGMKRDFGDIAECNYLHARRCMENGKGEDAEEGHKAAMEVCSFQRCFILPCVHLSFDFPVLVFFKECLESTLAVTSMFEMFFFNLNNKEVDQVPKDKTFYFRSCLVPMQVYRSGLTSSPSLKLYELCAAFLEEQLKTGGSAESHSQTVAAEAEAIYSEAHSKEGSTESMAEHHIGLLLGQGRVRDAEEVLKKLCGVSRFRQSGILWVLRVGVGMSLGRLEAGGEKGRERKERIGKVVREALAAVPMAQAAEVWRLVRTNPL